MLRFVAALVAIAALAHSAPTAECGGSPSPNAQPNLSPVYTSAPVFVKSVPNAQLWTVGEGDDIINVVHLWGTPYEMGYAHGALMNETAQLFFNAVWGYLELQVELAINGSEHFLKPWFVDLVSELSLEGALNWEISETAPFTGPYFNQEIQGMADATGFSALRIQQIHMIGELTKGGCSMFGAWGPAIQNTNSQLMQLRALDWDVTGPFKDYPQITVYHPIANSGNGHAFANIGWTGWLGSITGISSVQMAISEIGVSFPDNTFGKESRKGTPFTYLLRDVLQFDETLADTKTHIENAHRTCDLIFGFGDAKSNQFNGVQYSASVANFMNDSTQMPLESWHPRMNSIVYFGMDWLCPGYDTVLNKQLTTYYGNLTLTNTKEYITAIVQTGDLHIAIYDLTNMILWTANARRDGASGPDMAYDRPFVQLDMNAVFATSPVPPVSA